MKGGTHPAVFLDRDGVLVEERGYLTRPEQLKPIPGAAQAVCELRAAGYHVVMATNQSAIARGMLTVSELELIHRALCDQLEREGARLNGVYFCPHHPEGVVPQFSMRCDCRKPLPGLVQRAARELNLALDRRSFLVGDQASDLDCAVAAGLRPILVRSGKPNGTFDPTRYPDLMICDSIAEVPRAILQPQTSFTSPQ